MRGLVLGLALVATPVVGAPPRKTDALLEKAKSAIRETLKDPGSAQFRLVRKGPDQDRIRVCGEVNSKNGYGGYVGFQKFVYFPDSGETSIFDETYLISPEWVRQQATLFGSCFR